MGNEGTNYSDLKQAASKAKSAYKELEDYSDLLTKKVLNKLSSLPGSDSKGYVSSAMSAARNKQNKLDQSWSDFQSFERDVLYFKGYAEQKDKEVSRRIDRLADPYKKGFSFSGAIEYIGNFLYDVVCVDIAGFVSNYIPLGDMFIDGLRNIGNTVSHWIENTRDWFKYGGGKYLANIIGSVVKVVGIVAGIIAVASCSIVAVAVVGVVAGGIYLLYEMGNMMATVDSNMTAMEESRKGNKGLAHYYAGVEGVRDYVQKNDMGNAATNRIAESLANKYEATGKAAGAVYKVACLVASFEVLGDVYGLDGKVVDHDFSMRNIKRNIQRQWYQKRLDAGIIFKHDADGGIKFGGINLLRLTGIEGRIDDTKDFFKGIWDSEFDFDKATAKEYSEHISGRSDVASTLFDFLTDGRSENAKSVETIDEFIKKPAVSKIPDVISSGISLIGQGGLSEITDTYLGPIGDIVEIKFDMIDSDSINWTGKRIDELIKMTPIYENPFLDNPFSKRTLHTTGGRRF